MGKCGDGHVKLDEKGLEVFCKFVDHRVECPMDRVQIGMALIGKNIADQIAKAVRQGNTKAMAGLGTDLVQVGDLITEGVKKDLLSRGIGMEITKDESGKAEG